MQNRLAAGYRYRLQLLLELADAENPARRAGALVDDAGARWRAGEGTLGGLLDEQCRLLREEALATLAHAGHPSLLSALRGRAHRAGGCLREPPVAFCDGSLVGLARWLRASGLEAHAQAGRPALDTVGEAARACGLLLTTDHRVLELGAVRDGRLATLWVPSSLTALEQLRRVVADLSLPRAHPRCMACGGVLRDVDMEEVAPRIPPRTALWLRTYSVCESCGGLYWPGTHWARIERALDQAFSAV